MDRMETLVAEHHAAVYRYAYRLCGSPHDAEDLSQQTFLAAQRKLEQLRDAASGRAWLFAILRNIWLKSLARRAPVPAANLDLDMEDLPAAGPSPQPFDPQRLQAALDELAPEFKLVVLMFYFEGCSYREMAAELDLPLGTVMSRLSRAKAHLRRRLGAAQRHLAGRAP